MPRAATSTGPKDNGRLPIVALGGSAGGFETLLKFFRTVPRDPGLAFLVVLHLDPTRESELSNLLAGHSAVPVKVARHGERVSANRAYVIPPNSYLTIKNGTLRLAQPREPRGLRLSVDALLTSLAHDAEDCAIGVILSGNGADGSVGLRSIKSGGGLTIVQDPSTAEYESMPRAAIATGAVDLVLPVEKMMGAIRKFVSHDYVSQNGTSAHVVGPDAMAAIQNLLHVRQNVDFSGYKKGTLTRRIHRRMGLLQLNRPSDYLKVLRADPREVAALFDDVLIRVTRFFREPETWRILESEVLPRLMREGPKDPIRAWVPGCSTGEEAYSIAMLLFEARDRAQRNVTLQVFASDLDEKALEIARAGFYHENNLADVSPERLQHFFGRDGSGYRVKQALRDVVTFAHHNVLIDPPFSRLDLLSCRNLLIYFEGPFQKRVIELFHFALKPGGFLVLGGSESIGSQTDLFQPLSKKDRVYRRTGGIRAALEMQTAAARGTRTALPEVQLPARESPVLTYARDQVLERYSNATVLVNRKFEIVSLFGPTAEYLSQPSGPLTADLLAWVPEGVRGKLRVALQAALRKNQRVEIHDLPVRRGGHTRTVSCAVELLNGPVRDEGLLLVAFRDQRQEAPPLRSKSRRDVGMSKVVSQLEAELKLAKEELQASVEQLESANQELRATNEEILSINEELQSTNEELETSKEELQSVNEELTTVNSQLELKIAEVQVVNDDWYNLLVSIDAPILFLDRQMRIRRFTSSVTRVFPMINADMGRPLADITAQLRDPTLLDDARDVLLRLTPSEKEISGAEAGYLRRIVPYRSGSDRIEGVVIVYTDISDRIRAATLQREAREFAEEILETLREPLMILDATLSVRSANSTFFQGFQLEPDRVLGRRLFDIGAGEWNHPALRQWLEGLVQNREEDQDDQVEVGEHFDRIGFRVLTLRAHRVERAGATWIVVAIEDATRRAAAESARDDVLREMVSWEEKERHRLALELHDEAGQHVTAFLLGLAALKTSQSDPAAAAMVQQLQGLADELAQRLHGLSLQLRPTALDEHGLGRALQSYFEDVSHRHHLDIDYQPTGAGLARLPPHIETVLYRVVQEAVTNILKHASATKVSIVLDRKREEVRLAVEDNGCGFDLAEGRKDPEHMGLRGMEERVSLANGSFLVESHPGSGTTIFVRIPLEVSGRGGGS